MKIAVLMGGTSAEREVSLATGREIARALRESGHDVVQIDTAHGGLIPGVGAARFDELEEVRGSEVVFIALHGGAGEDGRLQALLDLIGVPYTGAGYLGSALAMDKLVSKTLFAQSGIPTAPWLVAPTGASAVESALGGFPVVVKPAREGSTVGVSVVKSADGLEEAIARASGFGGPVIVEKYIVGRELAVGILGEEALPVVEISPSHEIYDYECKYTQGKSEYRVPAPLGAECTEELQGIALAAHRLLRLTAYSRIDFRLDESERPWCLEANSLPGMTETSLLPKAAAAVGISFNELCERIVRLALEPRSGDGTRPPGPV